MRVQLEIDDPRAFTGQLVGPDGERVRFVGRLGLMAALEQVIEAGAEPDRPPAAQGVGEL